MVIRPSLPSRDSTPPSGDDTEEQPLSATPALVVVYRHEFLCAHQSSVDRELIKNPPLMTTQLERRL